MFDNVKNYLKRALGGTNGLTVMLGCNEADAQDYYNDPYNNPSFCLAMQKRVEATKMIEVGVFAGEGKNKKENKNHTLSPLLEYTSRNTSYGDFIDYVLNWSIGRDNGVLIEKVVGMTSMAPDLIAYNPDNFTIYFDNARINKIVISNPSKVITDEKELKNFIWVKSANYYQSIAGIAPGTSSTGLSNQRSMGVIGSYIKKVWTWNWAIASNTGKVGGVISSKEGYSLSAEDREEIRDKYAAMNTGNNNGKPLVLGGNATFTDTSKNPTDADWLNGEATSHERICLSVGVPPELVGGGDSTYANRKEAKKELYTDTIIPWYNDFIKQLNRLLKVELKGSYLDIKTGSIEALKEDKAQELKALETAKDRLTVGEYRKEYSRITGIDLKEVKNSDVIIIGTETLENIVIPIGGDGTEKAGDI